MYSDDINIIITLNELTMLIYHVKSYIFNLMRESVLELRTKEAAANSIEQIIRHCKGFFSLYSNSNQQQ